MTRLMARMLITGTLVLTALALAAPAMAQSPVTINVTTTLDGNLATSGSTTCSSDPASPAAGACSLRAAVQAADNYNADTASSVAIVVPAGTYKFTVANTDTTTYDLSVTTGVPLTISGAGAASTIVEANFLDRVFSIASSSSVAISGLTMQDGRPGGLGNVTSCPSTAAANEADGGGIDFASGTLTLAGDVLTGNMAPGNGGGLHDASSGQLTITATTVSNNIVCDFSGDSSIFGGGISSTSTGAVTIDSSTISGNANDASAAASANLADGGGLSESGGATLTLTNTSVSGNSTVGQGGGISGDGSGHFNMFADLINGNTASGRGGGFEDFNDDTDTFVNVTVAGNTASDGGGIDSGCGTDTIRFSTITGNTATGFGGNLSGGECPGITLDDTIVAGGTANGGLGGANCGGPTGFTSNGYNLFDDTADNGAQCGANGTTDIVKADPKLGPLQNNGGPTETVGLLAGSPAIDAANPDAANSTCTTETKNATGTAVDQRGFPRPQGAACDIGAFEATPDDSLTSSVQNNPITVGQQDTVTDTITNSGPHNSDGTTFTDPTAGFTVNSVTASQGSCTHTTNTVSCSLGTLTPGESVTVTIVVTGTSPGVFTLNGSVAESEFDPTPGNNTASVAITVVAPPAPGKPSADLAIAITASRATVTSGENLTYTLTTSNLGPDTGTGVTVADALPKGFTLRSARSSIGSCSGKTTVICDLGSLAVGAHDTITLTVTTSGGGRINDTATITGTLPDPNIKNNRASVPVDVRTPAKPTAEVKGVLAACQSERSTIHLTVDVNARAGLRKVSIKLGGRVLMTYRARRAGVTHRVLHVAIKADTLLAGRHYFVLATVVDSRGRTSHRHAAFSICPTKVKRGFTG
jgi:uncharacterized repeat protein (TIGR01451 family)